MVRKRTYPLIRFLIDERQTHNNVVLYPWTLYQLPLDLVAKVGVPYEVVPGGSPLRVGRRLQQMIASVGLQPSGGGCCSGCLGIQGTLDVAQPGWIRAHLDELVEQIQQNAKGHDVSVPRKIIKGAILVAILLERRRLRVQEKRKQTGG